MRWDRNYESSNVEDRRSEGGAGLGGFGGGGGGFPLWGIFALAGRFGWKGILVALILVGGLMYGGNLCTGTGSYDRAADQRPGAPPHPAGGPRPPAARPPPPAPPPRRQRARALRRLRARRRQPHLARAAPGLS